LAKSVEKLNNYPSFPRRGLPAGRLGVVAEVFGEPLSYLPLVRGEFLLQK